MWLGDDWCGEVGLWWWELLGVWGVGRRWNGDDPFEVVKAFVVLKPQFSASDALSHKLQEYVRSRLSKHAYPKEIEFIEALPKTSSGKIQRNLLKQQEIAKMQGIQKVG